MSPWPIRFHWYCFTFFDVLCTVLFSMRTFELKNHFGEETRYFVRCPGIVWPFMTESKTPKRMPNHWETGAQYVIQLDFILCSNDNISHKVYIRSVFDEDTNSILKCFEINSNFKMFNKRWRSYQIEINISHFNINL